MSVLAGVFAPGSPLPPDRLDALARGLPSPDGRPLVSWRDGDVGWVAAADSSQAADPASGRAVLVAGRLAHADVLARRYGRVPKAVLSDAALVLSAVDREGPAALDALDGSHVTVLWDAPTRTLHVVRDAFGTRPLVYAHRDGRLVFASATAALLVDGVPADPDLWRVAELLTGVSVDPEASAFAAIRRLPAARRLTVGPDGRMSTTVTWRVPALPREPEGALDDAVAEALAAAVATRSAASDAPGAYLSGGLDSSTVAVLLAGQHAGRLDAVSAAFPGLPRADETAYQEAVARTAGLRRHVWDRWDVSPIATDDPRTRGIADPVVMPTWPMEIGLLTTAREIGVGTLFSGHGGDHLFDLAPDAVGAWLLERGRLGRAWREARATSDVLGGSGASRLRQAVARSARWHLPPDVRRRRTGTSGGLLHPDLRAALRYDERIRDAWPAPASAADEHAVYLSHAATHDGLERLASLADAVGVRLAFPFWDRPLVDTVARLSPLDLFAGGRSRPVIRRAMGERLPTEVRTRTSKASFNSLLNVTVRRHAGDALDAMLAAPGSLAAWADLAVLRASWAKLSTWSDDALRRERSADSQHLMRAHALWRWAP